ncbi:MAG: hypothetical protein HC771_08000 [Synechococcales cyanobacterium CRU_2_2]|nr:hypothetical protein [Synechococcales cyanobacterium CRU_2_2]
MADRASNRVNDPACPTSELDEGRSPKFCADSIKASAPRRRQQLWVRWRSSSSVKPSS